MRNLTNTMLAWTPSRQNYLDAFPGTYGRVALVTHPWPRRWGPFPYAKDFGASLSSVQQASLDERKAMLDRIVNKIVADGISRHHVLDVIQCLEEMNGEAA
jgi:hypothetical protein